MKKKEYFDLLLIAALAFSVRLIYILQLAKTPFFEFPVVDAGFHDAWARDILDKGIGHEGAYFRAPLYPYFLAFIYNLTNGSYFAARIVQVFLGTTTALLTYLLAFNLTRKRNIALSAGIGAALYGMLIYLDGELLVETLFIPLLLAACYLYSRSRNAAKIYYFVLPGILLGMALITRPTAFIVLPVFLIDILRQRAKSPNKEFQVRKMLKVTCLLIGCFLPILPVTWHNVYQGGDFVLVASSGGVNFYIGNNEQSDGLHSMFPNIGTKWDLPIASLQAHKVAGRVLKSSEISKYYFKLGWDFILRQPCDAAKLTARKFLASWNRKKISNNRDLYFFESETSILPFLNKIGFWLVGPLALLGWWIAIRRKLLQNWFLWLVPGYMAGVIAFFVTARFRAPLIPFLLICASVALIDLFKRHDRLFSKERITSLSLLIVFALFVNLSLFDFAERNAAHAHFSLGNALMEAGDLEGAKQAYGWTLRVDSTYTLVHMNLGVIAYREGDMERAEQEYLKELELNSNEAMALNNMGVLRFSQGRLHEARRYYENAYELQPYFSDAKYNLAECLFQIGLERVTAGETRNAAEFFAQAVELNSENPLYHYNFALALGRMGCESVALDHLRESVRLAPNLTEARNLMEQIESHLSGETQLAP